MQKQFEATSMLPSTEIQEPLNVRAPLRGGVILGLVGTILLGLGVSVLSGIDVLDMSLETAKVLCGVGTASMFSGIGLVKYGFYKAKQHEEDQLTQQIHINYDTFSVEDLLPTPTSITPDQVNSIFYDTLQNSPPPPLNFPWFEQYYFGNPKNNASL